MVTTTLDFFNDPFFIGFDRQIKDLQNLHRNTSNYPPHNISKVKGPDEMYVIELALAGFKKEDIEVEQDKNVLTIKGSSHEDPNKEYLYKGIGARSFVKTFSLAEYVKVNSVFILDGILMVGLTKFIPESERPVKFDIHDFDAEDSFGDLRDLAEEETVVKTKRTKK
jgi:HSP20 family molecular chaperone IbpA